jgi:chorismate synthase
VAESMVALVLASAFMEKFGGDNMGEIERHYQAYLESVF